MQRDLINNLFARPYDYTDKTVVIGGWVRTSRDSKTIGFIELNDGSCFKNLQIVFDAANI